MVQLYGEQPPSKDADVLSTWWFWLLIGWILLCVSIMVLMVVGHIFKCTKLNNFLFCRWGRNKKKQRTDGEALSDDDDIAEFRADDQTGIFSVSRLERGHGTFANEESSNDSIGGVDTSSGKKKKKKKNKEEQVIIHDDGAGLVYTKRTQFFLKIDDQQNNNNSSFEKDQISSSDNRSDYQCGQNNRKRATNSNHSVEFPGNKGSGRGRGTRRKPRTFAERHDSMIRNKRYNKSRSYSRGASKGRGYSHESKGKGNLLSLQDAGPDGQSTQDTDQQRGSSYSVDRKNGHGRGYSRQNSYKSNQSHRDNSNNSHYSHYSGLQKREHSNKSYSGKGRGRPLEARDG